jgi:hypothetical protein
MGRHRKLGNEICPTCQNLFRIRKKKVRSRTTAKWVRRSYARHNDPNIPEHYIDNFTRPKQMTPYREMQDGYSNFGRVVRETTRRLMKLPLTDQELEEMWSAMEWVTYNIACPMEILGRVYSGKLKVSQKKRQELEIQLLQGLKSKKNIFGPGGLESLSLYQKYIMPSNINRRKALNQKIRDSYNYPPRTLPDLDLPPTS